VKQSERVPYTHLVRPGGTKQAAQCRRRRAPEEDVAGTRKQGIILLPNKQSTAEGQSSSPGTAPAPENKKRASQSRHPPRRHGRPGLGTPTTPAQCSPPSPPRQVKGRTKQTNLAATRSRLLSTLSKGVVAGDNPAKIHHGSEWRLPTTDHLMLCWNTR
jgi:hypothetical protein